MIVPKVLLSDLGGVTVLFRAGMREERIGEMFGLSREVMRELVWLSPEFADLERGKLSFEQFFDHCTARFLELGSKRPAVWNLEVFDRVWSEPIEGWFKQPATLLHRLAKHVTVVSASNISEHDLAVVERKFPEAVAHIARPTHSFRIGARKGDADYFRILLHEAGACWPEECLFLDDNDGHVAAAKRRHIPSVLVQGGGETVDYERLCASLLSFFPSSWIF